MSATPTNLSPQNTTSFTLDKNQPIHFMGIGGVGMSALAKVLLKQGFTVSGSDQASSAYSQALIPLGATVHIGHRAENIPQNALVVLSTAIKADNPERQAAEAKQHTIIHRSNMLKAITELAQTAIAVTGTHGKTTITGMLGTVFSHAQLDPTVIAGGKLPGFNTNALCGASNQYLILESDESDQSMQQYKPAVLLISNLEFDHPDHYPGGLEQLLQLFLDYVLSLPSSTKVVFNLACANTRWLYEKTQHAITPITVWASTSTPQERCDYWLENHSLNAEGGYQATAWHRHGELGPLWMQVPGIHNLTNALLCVAVSHQLQLAGEAKLTYNTIRQGLAEFKGMGRRFDKLGKINGAWVIDDYAHHPTEVEATLQAAKAFNQQAGRVIAVFQPHRYTRFQSLWTDFLAAFDVADEVILLDVYAAGDPVEPEHTSEKFIQQLNHPGKAYYAGHHFDAIARQLTSQLTDGDLLLLMGAGDITELAHLIASPQKES